MSKTIIGAMPIRTVGLTPGHRWCGELRSVKPAVNNGKGARGLVQGLNSLNATYIRQGRIRDRPRKLAKDLRNGHLDAGQAPVAWGILPQPPMQDLIKQKALAQTLPQSRKAIWSQVMYPAWVSGNSACHWSGGSRRERPRPF